MTSQNFKNLYCMKKIFLFLALMTMTTHYSQDKVVLQSQISVSGEGKVKVVPDEVVITVAVETKGENSSKVKSDNDATVDKVLKYLYSTKIDKKDIKTDRVSLYPMYDYNKKKNYHFASQTISITLRDLSQYDVIMQKLTENGVNRVDGVTFQSSKIEQLKSEARVLAVKDAQKKANDFAGALNQKVGKAILVSDNSQSFYNPPMYKNVMFTEAETADNSRETLAPGEMEVNVNVNITFVLE
jgi:uncharacterized protein YggE